MATFYYIPGSDSLVHHGVKGQHWGERHYQNKDGTWTEEGKLRRRKNSTKEQRIKEKNAKTYMNLYNSMYDCVDKAFSNNKEADPWSDPKVRRAANAYLKNSPNDPDAIYSEVYKNKKAADRKMIKGIAAGAALGGITIGALGLTGGVPIASLSKAIAIGGAFCGTVGSTVVERMESVKRANRDYNQALQDTITYMYDTVELDY